MSWQQDGRTRRRDLPPPELLTSDGAGAMPSEVVHGSERASAVAGEIGTARARGPQAGGVAGIDFEAREVLLLGDFTKSRSEGPSSAPPSSLAKIWSRRSSP